MSGASESIGPAPRATAQALREAATGVVVLGSGRSGTSAITRAFVLSGFHAGAEKDLLGPTPWNPLGHFEPLPILEANEALLEMLGASWWPGAPAPELEAERRDEVVRRLRGLIESLARSAEGAPIAIKEPRINTLLPLWQQVIEETLHPVLAIRDPLEIALSHERRDGTTVRNGLAAWELQTTQLLRWLNGRTVTIAPYARLTADPSLAERIVSDAASHLDPERAALLDPTQAASALRPELHRESAGDLDHDDYLTARQARLWEYLRQLPPGDAQPEVAAEHREASKAAEAATREESERVRLERDHATLKALVKEERARLEWRVEVLEDRLQTAIRAEEAHAAEIAGIRSSVSWRITAPLRRLKAACRGFRATGRE